MTATAIQTPPRLETEPTGGVFSYRAAVLPPGPGGVGCDLPPPPPGVGAPPSVGPLTARVVHIFNATAHGSPSAPVCYGGGSSLLSTIAEAFRRATARRVHPDHTPHHPKGTA